MINYTSQFQTKIEQFSGLCQLNLDADNRWIQLSSVIPWDKLVSVWTRTYNDHHGSSGINPRVLIGALIIKHKLNLTDDHAIEIIRENPYMQFFLGLDEFTPEPIFSPSLFVELRKKVDSNTLDQLSNIMIKVSEIGSKKDHITSWRIKNRCNSCRSTNKVSQ